MVTHWRCLLVHNNSVTTPLHYHHLTYDAWGNILTFSGSLASTLGRYNPLTYRGYVYDNETGLYYLQSRYYNPKTGRFINADIYTTTGQGFIGNNMFTYCLNNPVNGCDPCGSCFHRWDAWNDCEKCGGKTIGDKWNDFTDWCADTFGAGVVRSNKYGITVSKDADFGSRTAGSYMHIYIRTIPTAGAVLGLCYVGSVIIPMIPKPYVI